MHKRGGQVVRESTGKHHQQEGGCVTLRADRLTACPPAPGPSDSLFNTSAESRAPPGTSAAGWQSAYPVSVGPPLLYRPAVWVKNKWEPGEDRVAGRGRVTEPNKEWEREILRKECIGFVHSCQETWRRLALLAFFISRSSSQLTQCPGCQMLPWRSPISLREEVFVFTLEMWAVRLRSGDNPGDVQDGVIFPC